MLRVCFSITQTCLKNEPDETLLTLFFLLNASFELTTRYNESCAESAFQKQT